MSELSSSLDIHVDRAEIKTKPGVLSEYVTIGIPLRRDGEN